MSTATGAASEITTWRSTVRETYARAATRPDDHRRGASCATSHSGLGCGSPIAFAGLAAGEQVLDLGSGAGFDCLAAALEVGRQGRVVGIDMTPEMVRLARRNGRDAGVAGVDFLQGEIERLPFADASFDVVVSNCVINLCQDKARVFAEACRVLKPNGRLAVADIVAVAPLPEVLRQALCDGCVGGATPLDALPPMLRDAGFESVDIEIAAHSGELLDAWAPEAALERFIAAANVIARKRVDRRST
jgi:arsenite methyltransferase